MMDSPEIDENASLLSSSSRKYSNYSNVSHVPEVLLNVENIDRITLSWHNINAFVPPAQSKWFRKVPLEQRFPKHILKNVNGIIRPGQLVALMGASGAGKTTMLNVLMNRNLNNLHVDGDIRINGKVVGDAIASISAYVQQNDLFIGTLKVREHLIFQAMLRMDKEIPYKERIRRVDEVISELGLKKCQHTIIGIPNRIKGISGGEMKRLAFASEVLTNPPLLFCDEPTSGLDSFMAANVVSLLKSLALKEKTILCTIHQPSSEVFAMFDRLLLMADGEIAYLGSTKKAQSFFKNLNHIVPANYNPADFYINTLAVVPGDEENCKNRVKNITVAFQESKTYLKTLDDLSALANKDDFSQLQVKSRKISPYKAAWCRQFSALMWRSWMTVMREPLILKIRLFQGIFLALFMGLIYLQQKMTPEGVMNINGALFMFLTNISMSNMSGVIHTFCSELTIFLREHKNGMYRVDTYFLTKCIADIPCYIIIPFLSAVTMYWMVGFYNDVITFLIHCGVVILVCNCAVSFGYMISCLSGSTTVAVTLASPVSMPFMIFGGFFLNSASVPVYFIWLEYLSWYKYGNEAASVIQWRNVDYIDCMNKTGCEKDGYEILNSLNFHESHLVMDFVYMFALLVGFRFIAFLALLGRSYTSK